MVIINKKIFNKFKTFTALLFLIFSFQSLTNADEVRDFEIEGIAIGDSLLDYFEKKKN